MKTILLLLLSLSAASACSVDKHQLWKCLITKADKNKNHMLEEQEIRTLVRENTYWYERLMKSPDSVVRQIENHCTGVPLTYGHFLGSSCFRHCGGIDGKRTIFNRLGCWT